MPAGDLLPVHPLVGAELASGSLHLEQIVTSDAERHAITAYAEGDRLGDRTLAVIVTQSEDWNQPYRGKPVKLDRHEATMGGSGRHRWITWPIRTSEIFESFGGAPYGRSSPLWRDLLSKAPAATSP
ncbi:hypothetical protein [Nonomuraea fuscirosea]|uniref:hypothetical protein n=1 Tax=Nonomuraea fuscirosea TaxID=1291556 RepID=UPI0033DCB688